MPNSPAPSSEVTLEWAGGESFRATSSLGVEIVLDGESNQGFSPMQALAASLGACMGIDVVLILSRMRVDLEEFRVTLEGERREEPPRHFERIRMVFEITGDVSVKKAERAVKLSREKYCSVMHTLRPDIEIETSVEILDR